MLSLDVDRTVVRAFYDAALASGGKDNGPCGPRAHYHPNYYGGVRSPEHSTDEAIADIANSLFSTRWVITLRLFAACQKAKTTSRCQNAYWPRMCS
jgi:hypothetical protein